MVFSSCCCSCCNDWSFCRSATLPPFAAGACTAHLGTTLKGNELGAGPDTAREMFRTVLAVSVLHSGKTPSNAAGDYGARVLTLRSSVDMSVFPSCYCCCSYSCCGCDTYSLPVADMGMMLQQVDAMTQVQYNMCLAVIAMLVTPAGGWWWGPVLAQQAQLPQVTARAHLDWLPQHPQHPQHAAGGALTWSGLCCCERLQRHESAQSPPC